MNIPKVSHGSFVLLVFDYKTGVLLNNDGSYYTNLGDDYFCVFDNFDTAKKYAETKIQNTPTPIEVMIYDHEAKLVKLLR